MKKNGESVFFTPGFCIIDFMRKPKEAGREQKAERRKADRGNEPRCEICGKPLTDPRSIILGMGPECWRKHRTADIICES